MPGGCFAQQKPERTGKLEISCFADGSERVRIDGHYQDDLESAMAAAIRLANFVREQWEEQR